MTIGVKDNRYRYSGNGVTTDFAYPVSFEEPSDIIVKTVVVATGVETLLTLTVDYTLSANEDFTDNGITVTLLVAPPVGTDVLIIGNNPVEQTINADAIETFSSIAIEQRGMDNIARQERTTRDLAERAVRLKDGTAGDPPEVGPLTPTETVVVDADGNLTSSAAAGGATNLSFSRDATTVTVESDTGTNAVLPEATGALAGVLGATDKAKLDSITGVVTAVFGRVGAVVAQLGDYTASLITNTPAGNISATTVQGAINELDTEKASTDAFTAGANGLATASGVADGTKVLFDNGVWAVPPGAGGGEANTGSNLGAGDGIFESKVGVDLRFKSLTAGANITLTASGTEIEIAGPASSGEANTASSSGAGASLVQAKSGVNLPFRSIIGGTNVTVVQNTNDLTLNVPGTDLSFSRDATTVTVESDTGADAILPAATGALAGVMVAADKAKLDGIASGAEVNVVDSVDGQTGAVDLSAVYEALGNQPINTQSGTNYQAALADIGKLTRMTNAAANTFTVPANATTAFAIGARFDIIQAGAGVTTITAAGGVTINSADANIAARAQFSGMSLVKVATDTWDLFGDLA